ARRMLTAFPTRRSSDLRWALGRPDEAPNAQGDSRPLQVRRAGATRPGAARVPLLVPGGRLHDAPGHPLPEGLARAPRVALDRLRSEEHTSELQSPDHLV